MESWLSCEELRQSRKARRAGCCSNRSVCLDTRLESRQLESTWGMTLLDVMASGSRLCCHVVVVALDYSHALT